MVESRGEANKFEERVDGADLDEYVVGYSCTLAELALPCEQSCGKDGQAD
ncbi:hypothetical protein DGo_PE0072 (plasmid) [Deinococcus gobiensis I-0]|uniref:Uncharacterized protein n=1 Tax=Deinococcus gobiensis (strain DSM 21396 / JCM 16679 / CGMCC 1.7299 / I-0) TaxID=745776 RepID=H8H3W9_DEIGI|nr:hypothetical protein DGo_PE0072 [Deinococcus gobiensis I-0]